MSNLWAFIRNFSASKFYESAQIGSLNGGAPFTIGAIFAVVPAPSSGSIFSNRGVNTGFSLGTVTGVGVVQAANGTAVQITGPINNTTGAALPDATDLATAEALVNAYKSSALNDIVVADTRGTNSPKTAELVHVALTVPPSGSQVLYVNGQVVHTLAVALASSNANVTIGNDPTHATANANLWLSGAFYHNSAYTQADIAAMFAASSTAKDLIGPSRLSATVDPLYMWSVKRGNFDARASWVSDGSAATPITMVRNGTWTPTGAAGDLIAADLSWMQV